MAGDVPASDVIRSNISVLIISKFSSSKMNDNNQYAISAEE